MKKGHFYPVILAGGSGTRFWPRSRRARAKQVLALDGDKTMIQQTFERLLPLAGGERFWVVTNDSLREVIRKQLKDVPTKQVLPEPAARNTAPAIGLAAFILQRIDPEAIIGMFPADHVITNEKRFRQDIQVAAALAEEGGNIVVLGIRPTRAETGYGYIEAGTSLREGVKHVRRFTEKPNAQRAEEFVAARNYFWNSGIFVWSARTLAAALREHLSETAPYLEEIAKAWGTKEFEAKFAELYSKCENISVDYAVLEPRSAKGEHSSHLYCIPADFGWNDLGSWAALYEHRKAQNSTDNVMECAGEYTLDAAGNYIYSPKKFVAAVGVKGLVVVETEDALLITTRDRSQDVGKIVKHLQEQKKNELV